MADRHRAVADRAEIERPAVLARELAHVRRGGVDQMVDEADALGEAQHLVGQAIADVARHAGRVAQLDEGLEQAHDGGAGQAGFRRQGRDGPVRPAAQGLHDGETAADGLDHRGSIMAEELFRITDFVDVARAIRRLGDYVPVKQGYSRKHVRPAPIRERPQRPRSSRRPAVARAQKFPSGPRHHGRAVSGRRRDRHRRARLCRAAVGDVGPAGRGRQQGRRQRHPGRRSRWRAPSPTGSRSSPPRR